MLGERTEVTTHEEIDLSWCREWSFSRGSEKGAKKLDSQQKYNLYKADLQMPHYKNALLVAIRVKHTSKSLCMRGFYAAHW